MRGTDRRPSGDSVRSIDLVTRAPIALAAVCIRFPTQADADRSKAKFWERGDASRLCSAALTGHGSEFSRRELTITSWITWIEQNYTLLTNK